MKSKKYTIIMLLLFLLLTLSACGDTGSSKTIDKTVDLSTLWETMLKADTTLPELVVISGKDEQAELNFSYLSDLSYDLIDDYFYAYAKDGTAEEIAVIHLKDKGDAAAMMDSLHEHITQRQGTFQEYSPEQVEMTEHAVVTRQGSYITLIISEKNGMIQKAFESCFE